MFDFSFRKSKNIEMSNHKKIATDILARNDFICRFIISTYYILLIIFFNSNDISLNVINDVDSLSIIKSTIILFNHIRHDDQRDERNYIVYILYIKFRFYNYEKWQ